MKCLDNEEKSECSQVIKLKVKLIFFTFLVGSSWILTCIRAYFNMFIWPSKEKFSDTCTFNRAEAWQRSTVKSCFNEVIWESMPERVYQQRCAICAMHTGRMHIFFNFICLLISFARYLLKIDYLSAFSNNFHCVFFRWVLFSVKLKDRLLLDRILQKWEMNVHLHRFKTSFRIPGKWK